MSHALVTIIAPLDLDRVADAENAIDKLGNPRSEADIRAALDKHEDAEHGTHFASLHAFRSQDGKRAYIAFEFSADGPRMTHWLGSIARSANDLTAGLHAGKRLE
jgi:hypothetical protein